MPSTTKTKSACLILPSFAPSFLPSFRYVRHRGQVGNFEGILPNHHSTRLPQARGSPLQAPASISMDLPSAPLLRRSHHPSLHALQEIFRLPPDDGNWLQGDSLQVRSDFYGDCSFLIDTTEFRLRVSRDNTMQIWLEIAEVSFREISITIIE